MLIGYARVSTMNQCLKSQVDLLHRAGCERVYKEKVSGAIDERKQLTQLVAQLKSGDVLVVTNLDRLARSTRGLLNIVEEIRVRNANLRSLGDAWADFTTPHGKLMLAVLAGLAEFERALIHSRTREGRVNARTRGVRFGRKPKLTLFQQKEALERKLAGDTLKEIAKTFNVSHSTISRLSSTRSAF